MKNLVLLLTFSCVLTLNAQTYLITFAGTGASTSVGSIKVENLMKGTSLTLSGTDILRLTGVTGISSIEDRQLLGIRIYPNPMKDYSNIEFTSTASGDAIISVCDVTGKPITQVQENLDLGAQQLRISGLKTGTYIITVKSKSYQYSGKLLCNSEGAGEIKVDKVSSIVQKARNTILETEKKSVITTIDMAYSSGDRIKFTGIFGIYSTVMTDVPASNKTITFNFIACTDADNNNYPIVNIGTQVWMAENLNTTKYNDGTPIPNISVNTAWALLTTGAYSDYNNTISNSTTYGRLYNWYTVDNNAATRVASNGGKNVCPTNWHVPSDAEWTTLTDYLTNNGYGYGGSGDDIAKSMASTSGWTANGTPGTVGNEQLSNNGSGFTALPSGYRLYDGSYNHVGDYGLWWSSSDSYITNAFYRYVYYYSSSVYSLDYYKKAGTSVRCIKD